MNNRVGIFWFTENTFVYKTQNVIDLKPDSLGFVDSTLQHQIEWEENLIYEQFSLSLYNTEYYNFPRGRVVFNFNLQTSLIYLDKKIFRKGVVKTITSKFHLKNTAFKFFTGSHYSCFKSI